MHKHLASKPVPKTHVLGFLNLINRIITLKIDQNKEFFKKLYESMSQMNEIIDGERFPPREFVVDALHVKEIRKKTGLTQQKFCYLIDVNLGLRNWEQGRCEPTGPSKMLEDDLGGVY